MQMKANSVVAVLAVLGAVAARPQGETRTSAPLILSQDTDVNPDGSFKYSYETENGIQVAASGNHNSARNIQGSYSYISPDGTPITTTYVADGTGFKPQGDHLPKAPEVPAALTRAWAYHAAKAKAKAMKEATPQQMSLQVDVTPKPLPNNKGVSSVSTDTSEVPAHLAQAWANYAEIVRTEGASRPSQEGEPSSDLVPPTATRPADFSSGIMSPDSQISEVPAHFLMAWKDHVANGGTETDATLPQVPYSDLVPPPASGVDGLVDPVSTQVDSEEEDELPLSVPAHFARAWATFAARKRIQEPDVPSSEDLVIEPFSDLVPPPVNA